ncbi:MAG: sialidase family protein [Planctomycetota bacterium]|nr:sialidase family protein [Planctomycetota bacterium]
MTSTNGSLLPSDWNPKAAADRVLAGLANICLPQVKGAHDSDFLIVDDLAYVVSMANDVQPGEDPRWPYVYDTLTIVEAATGKVLETTTFAASGKVYENRTLEAGACFVPRIVRKDERTLRVFFASEVPKARQSQTWYLDYDLARGRFDWNIHQAFVETADGRWPMQPQHLHRAATTVGLRRPAIDYGLYAIDGFKRFDGRGHANGRVYAVLNNFIIGQNALATLSDDMSTFKVLGHFVQPGHLRLSESAVQRLPDGTWSAITRLEEPPFNYMFATSPDGVTWSTHQHIDRVPNGAHSKPTFERFGGVYHQGWQESTRIDNVSRSVFNIDVSRDGVAWERKYRFETGRSFQYPVFREHEGAVYLTVTQGDHSPSRKERIMFGRLE